MEKYARLILSFFEKLDGNNFNTIKNDLVLMEMSIYVETDKLSKKIKEMKIEEIYVLWTTFLEEYKQYLHVFDYKWNDKLKSLKMFIYSNTKLPSSSLKQSKLELETQLGSWYLRQKLDYMKKNMKKEGRYNQWTHFIQDSKYKHYFK